MNRWHRLTPRKKLTLVLSVLALIAAATALAAWMTSGEGPASGKTASLSALTVTASAQAAPCWEAVVEDWYDSWRVNRTYPIHCYREALRNLPEDMRAYSSAPEDIARAMRQTISLSFASRSPSSAAVLVFVCVEHRRSAVHSGSAPPR